ncbi:hypothetical protein WME98_20425 [Sorangium sp. So ce296]|uniref:hypothetical protein n=1 Tax=Sorangium sp. So ce296 TaxID=3133296 RepID=UPI003F5D810B
MERRAVRANVLMGSLAAALIAAGVGAGGCTQRLIVICDDPNTPEQELCSTVIDRYRAERCEEAGPGAEGCEDAGAPGEPDPQEQPGTPEDPEGEEGGADASTCSGQCVPGRPLGWFEPLLLWFGSPGDAPPECPPQASVFGYEGHGDLVVEPHRCAACACDPPDAACELPEAWAAYDTRACGATAGAERTSFAAPEGWDGACTAAGAIPAGEACGGGPCAQSLEIQAPRVVPGACAPRRAEPPPAPPAVRWGTYARACVGVAIGRCADPGEVCAPAPPAGNAAPPVGFSTCIIHHNVVEECPSFSPYSERHVFYQGADDTRACTECSCGEPAGGACSILASAYSDSRCSQVVVSARVSSEATFCGAVPRGVALGSKSASVVDIAPGTCAPGGGEPTGGIAPREAMTFCCLPE